MMRLQWLKVIKWSDNNANASPKQMHRGLNVNKQLSIFLKNVNKQLMSHKNFNIYDLSKSQKF